MARKAYSFEDLSRLVGEDYAWRRKELQLIKSQIPKTKGSSQDAFVRAAVPILYAHWEGFVKNSCEIYLEYVAKKYLPHKELKPQFIALSLTKQLGTLEIKNLEEKSKTVSFLITELDKNSNIQTKNIIQTNSNLKYHIFEQIIFAICLDESKFIGFKSLINDLVEARNHIAHGQYLKVEFATYLIMLKDIQDVMRILKTEIENSATNMLFKAA